MSQLISKLMLYIYTLIFQLQLIAASPSSPKVEDSSTVIWLCSSFAKDPLKPSALSLISFSICVSLIFSSFTWRLARELSPKSYLGGPKNASLNALDCCFKKLKCSNIH